MKKETLIAVFFGVIFGGIVAVFLLAKNKEFRQTNTKTIGPTEKVSKVAKNVVINIKTLEVSAPLDGSVYDAKTVDIKGRADKEALIIIQSGTKEVIFKNDKEQFAKSFPLALGENLIKVTAYAKDSKVRPQEREIRVYNLDDEL